MIRKVNKICSIMVGVYFLGIFIYLLVSAVIPFTLNGEWRGWIDIIAVGFYLAGVIPLLGLSLINLGIIGRRWSEEQKLKYHSTFVGVFLVVAHIAMIFGMLDPSIGGDHSHQMHMHM
ncbi:permease [Geobacillus sp. 44C]|nr:permease [Geobacillus sp. 44C]